MAPSITWTFFVDLNSSPAGGACPGSITVGLVIFTWDEHMGRSVAAALNRDPTVDPPVSPQRAGESGSAWGSTGAAHPRGAQLRAEIARSDPVARHLDTVEVTGSIPE